MSQHKFTVELPGQDPVTGLAGQEALNAMSDYFQTQSYAPAWHELARLVSVARKGVSASQNGVLIYLDK